jgi:crotonobetainyl-CoA:carnitine CoA-transferase CaiB-like acyl-CoA transferase
MTGLAQAGSQLPLSGVKVIDLSEEFGPHCTKVLADFGASVVEIEPPTGKVMRTWQPRRETATGSLSLSHVYHSANKQSVTLNLGMAEGRALLDRLLESADVVVISWTPDELAERQINLDEWLVNFPRLVVCSVTGFGLTGPYRNFRSSSMIAQAMGGFLYPVGPSAGPPVVQPGDGISILAGTHAALASLGALRARSRVGGQLLDISAHEVLAGHDQALQRYGCNSVIPRRHDGLTVPSGQWRCADGRVEFQVWSAAQWNAFRSLLGDPPELRDQSYLDPVHRASQGERLRSLIARQLSGRTVREVVDAAQSLRIPSAPVNTPGGLLADDHARDRGTFTTVSDAVLGDVEMVRVPIRSSAEMWSYRTSAPALGAHNRLVYQNQLGLSEEEFAACSAIGAI